jgi:hypothetical protein
MEQRKKLQMKTCSIRCILALCFCCSEVCTRHIAGAPSPKDFCSRVSSSLAFNLFPLSRQCNFSFPLFDQCNFSNSLDRRLTVFPSMELIVSSLGIGFYKQVEREQGKKHGKISGVQDDNMAFFHSSTVTDFPAS